MRWEGALIPGSMRLELDLGNQDETETEDFVSPSLSGDGGGAPLSPLPSWPHGDYVTLFLDAETFPSSV